MTPYDWGRGVRRRLKLAAVPAGVLELVRLRDGEGCALCRNLRLTPPPDEPIELDHRQPLAAGGDYHWTNLQWLCRSHNRARGARRPARGELPAWLRQLALAGRLEAHVAWCHEQEHPWCPTGWLKEQVDALGLGAS